MFCPLLFVMIKVNGLGLYLHGNFSDLFCYSLLRRRKLISGGEYFRSASAGV